MAHFLPPELERQVNKLEWPYRVVCVCVGMIFYHLKLASVLNCHKLDHLILSYLQKLILRKNSALQYHINWAICSESLGSEQTPYDFICLVNNSATYSVSPVLISSVVLIHRLIVDLTIFTYQFWWSVPIFEVQFFSDYLHMIKRHTFCVSYLSIYFLCFHYYFYLISCFLKFHEECKTHDVWCTWGRVNVHEKTDISK